MCTLLKAMKNTRPYSVNFVYICIEKLLYITEINTLWRAISIHIWKTVLRLQQCVRIICIMKLYLYWEKKTQSKIYRELRIHGIKFNVYWEYTERMKIFISRLIRNQNQIF